MNCRVEGMGTAVPPFRISQDDACEQARSVVGDPDRAGRVLEAIYRRSGVRYRHSVVLEQSDADGAVRQRFYPPAAGPHDRGPTTGERMAVYETASLPLALEACRAALSDAGASAQEMTHLVTVSCTGFAAPGLDVGLISRLGLPHSVSRTHIGFMGCHAAMNAMRVAAGYTRSDPEARVLIAAVELCSLHQQYGPDPEQLVANALFADGAGALVVTGGSNGSGSGVPAPAILAGGSTILSDSADLMAWHIGDHGFRMRLSSRVPAIIRGSLASWMDDWLRASGRRRDQIGGWALHPGGPRIISAAAEALNLADSDVGISRDVLGEFGNMSSPTVLFILERMRRAQVPRPWVALGFGPGLAVEAVLIE